MPRGHTKTPVQSARPNSAPRQYMPYLPTPYSVLQVITYGTSTPRPHYTTAVIIN